MPVGVRCAAAAAPPWPVGALERCATASKRATRWSAATRWPAAIESVDNRTEDADVEAEVGVAAEEEVLPETGPEDGVVG